MNTKRLIILGVILAVLVFGGTMIVYAQANNDQTSNNSLEGVWMGKVTFAEEFGMPETFAPVAFTKDGLIINSTEAGAVSVGLWQQTKDKKFAVIFSGGEVADGTAILYKIRATLQLSQDGKQFSGPFVNDIYDTAGNLLFTVTGTVSGERIYLEPLE